MTRPTFLLLLLFVMVFFTVFCVALLGQAMGCDYCVDNPGEKEIWATGIDAHNGMEQTQRCFIVLLRRINEIDKKIDKLLQREGILTK